MTIEGAWDTELSTSFGPIDVREGGSIFYDWPRESTRGFVVVGWTVRLGSNGGPNGGSWAGAFRAAHWFGDNAIARLLTGAHKIAETPLAAVSRRRPSPLVAAHPHQRVSRFATAFFCGEEQLRTEIEIAAPLPADVYSLVTFNATLVGRRE